MTLIGSVDMLILVIARETKTQTVLYMFIYHVPLCIHKFSVHLMKTKLVKKRICRLSILKKEKKIVVVRSKSEHEQEIPQSHTTDQPTAS